MAGESWISGFCKRQGIALRQPEKCSLGRIMGFNKPQVARFYKNLKSLYEKRNYTPDEIFNMDETGSSNVPNKLPKVFASKSKKLVGKVASAERGQLVTAVCCVSASGVYVPPALIFARKRMKEELYINAPPGTLKLISDSGFINTDLFYQWMTHFKNFTKPSPERHILLILDNHSSHRDLRVVQFCRDNYIDMLSLPPHSSHKMQPLDIGFFGPLKRAYSVECDNWMVSHSGRPISLVQIAGLFNAAYGRVSNLEKAQNSFRRAGIYPYDPDIFGDEDFAPSLVTEIHLEESSVGYNENGDKKPDTNEPAGYSKEIRTQDHLDAQPGCSKDTKYSPIRDQVTPPPYCSTPIDVDIMNLDIVCEDGKIIQSQEVEPNVATKVSEILPLPHIEQNQKRRQNKSQKSEILSSTPFKNELEASVREKENKEVKKMKAKRNLKTSVARQDKKQKKKTTAKENIYCPGCEDLYVEPPDEDWIMCHQCESWWHESCTTYVVGKFKCFNC